MRSLLLALFLTLSGTAVAEPAEVTPQDQNVPAEIPTSEKEFVNTIDKYSKSTILEQFGEPSKKNDIKHEQTGEIIASIWYYRFLNTSSSDGAYYPTTELDFVGDKVVMVVFMNHDGSEVESEAIAPSPPDNGTEALPEFHPELTI